MHTYRAGVLRNSQTRYTHGLRSLMRDSGETGQGYNDARDAELFGFNCRPHRGRCARPSTAVAGYEGIAAHLLGASCDLLCHSTMGSWVTTNVRSRQFRVGDDAHAGETLLQQLAVETKHLVPLEVVVVHLTDRHALQAGKTRSNTRVLSLG